MIGWVSKRGCQIERMQVEGFVSRRAVALVMRYTRSNNEQ
jgi:hypothetical protein